MMKNLTTLVATDGWNSLEELFGILNSTVSYVVLQNFERLPHHFESSIDVLTDNREQLVRILKHQKVKFFHSRKHVKVDIGGRQVMWNIHGVGDGYYCSQWEQDMLLDKVRSQENVYVLNDEHHFYSFIYYALIHKKWITKDHYAKAEHLLTSLLQTGSVHVMESEKESFPDAFDYYFDLLNDYMTQKNYVFCCPHQGLVYSSTDSRVVASMPRIAEQLARKFGLNHVKPIRVSSPIRKKGFCVKLQDCLTFYQAWLNDKKIFIKHGGYRGTHKTEFELCHRLNKISQNNFPETFFYSDDQQNRCIAYEFLEGELLESKIYAADFSPSEKENIIVQLKEIAKSLLESGVVHRDLLSKNFIMTMEGKLKLIDFELAVDSKEYNECFAVRKNPLYFRPLFEKPRCDAVLPLLDILKAVGSQENDQDTYRDVESFLREHSGKVFIKFKYQHLYFLQLIWHAVRDTLKSMKNGIARFLG